MKAAYACRLSEANYPAIASEKPNFDLEETRAWVEEYGGGFFIRDEERRAFDCEYMPDLVFHQIYAFDSFCETDLFHLLVRL